MCNPIKVFISYTLRDKQLSVDLLSKFKFILGRIPEIETYIDIIDNQNKENPQGEVIARLDSANVVWIINSEMFTTSPWAIRELDYAEKTNKQIFYWDLADVLYALNIKDKSELDVYIKPYLTV